MTPDKIAQHFGIQKAPESLGISEGIISIKNDKKAKLGLVILEQVAIIIVAIIFFIIIFGVFILPLITAVLLIRQSIIKIIDKVNESHLKDYIKGYNDLIQSSDFKKTVAGNKILASPKSSDKPLGGLAIVGGIILCALILPIFIGIPLIYFGAVKLKNDDEAWRENKYRELYVKLIKLNPPEQEQPAKLLELPKNASNDAATQTDQLVEVNSVN